MEYNKSMQPTANHGRIFQRGSAAADLNSCTSKSLRLSVISNLLIISICVLLSGCARTVITHELRYPEEPKSGYKVKELAPPDYPQSLYQGLVEGVVEIDFDIDKDGKTTNIEVTNESPEAEFNKAALASVENTTYMPPGELPYERNTRIVRFKLEDKFIKKRCSELSVEIANKKPLCQD